MVVYESARDDILWTDARCRPARSFARGVPEPIAIPACIRQGRCQGPHQTKIWHRVDDLERPLIAGGRIRKQFRHQKTELLPARAKPSGLATDP
jgi:hypothetical protein